MTQNRSESNGKILSREASITTKNISMIVLLKILQYPFLFLFLITVPRMMGADTYGQYVLLISIITVIGSIMEFGSSTEMFSRVIPELEAQGEVQQIKKLFCNILVLQVLISLIAIAVLLPVLEFNYAHRFSYVYFLLIAVIVIVRNSYSVIFNLLFGLNEQTKFTSIFPIRRMLALPLTVALFYSYGLIGVTVSILIVDFCLWTIGFYWLKGYFSIHYCTIDYRFVMPYLKYNFIFYICYSLLTLWQRLGNILIEKLTNSIDEVAFFDIPNQIFILITMFILIIISSLAPIYTKLLLENKEDKLYKWSALIVKYVSILCTVMFWGFVASGNQLISFAVGADYDRSYANGVVQLLSIFPLIIAYLGILYSIVYKKPEKYLLSLAYGLISFVLVAILAIPTYAALGCAIATFVSCLIYAAVLLYFFSKQLIHCLSNIVWPMILGFVFLPALFVNQPLATTLLIFFGCALIYAAILIISRVVNISEIKEIFWALK